jgi:diguanylate cyclase (GGDEF)-like protein
MKVLVVEDDSVTLRILTRVIEARGHEVSPAESAEAAQLAFALSTFPLVLLDLNLPGMSGIDFCRWLRQQPQGDQTYILVGTAGLQEQRGGQTLRSVLAAGADDYLSKPYTRERLNTRLSVAEKHIREIERRRRAEERLAYLATRDPLTDLFNRNYLPQALEEALLYTGTGVPCALLSLDLDDFKIVNDSLGHKAGDRLLVEVAQRLRESCRATDIIVRIGGDEFVVVLMDLDLEGTRQVAERIRSLVGGYVLVAGDQRFSVTTSIGLVMLEPGLSADDQLARSDAACYRAKSKGRNRIEIFHESEDDIHHARTHTNWKKQIEDALANQTLELWFQPVVEIATGDVVFEEALLRMRGADQTFVLPGAFLVSAERFGLMVEIDRYVLRLAATHLAARPELRLSLNLSGQSLVDPWLVDWIGRTIGQVPGGAERVDFEITETSLISNLKQAGEIIRELRGSGYRFALDDFGSGFSSFGYLKNIELDLLKIDGSFILDLPNQSANQVFVRAMNDIAHQLGMDSVAEYVEDQETMELLHEIGVDYAQGLLISEPRPFDL